MILNDRFRIAYSSISELSENFRSFFERWGEFLAGDEKVDRFTGDSKHIRLVPNKPDKVGFWHYELSCRLAKVYLICSI